MDRTGRRRTSPWIAFAAGAVAMLAVLLLAYAWRGGDNAAEAAAALLSATDAVPDIAPPRLPDFPRVPDPPRPQPR